eukprot:ANDGO_03830.mRNA.1 hypothetical protein
MQGSRHTLRHHGVRHSASRVFAEQRAKERDGETRSTRCDTQDGREDWICRRQYDNDNDDNRTWIGAGFMGKRMYCTQQSTIGGCSASRQKRMATLHGSTRIGPERAGCQTGEA